MKKILLIATGGTIASSESSEGLTPSIDVKTLLTYIPEIESICHLEGISVMRVDSTNTVSYTHLESVKQVLAHKIILASILVHYFTGTCKKLTTLYREK